MDSETMPSEAHPLDGKDDWECYDQHIAQRNQLIEAKRESEDGFVKTVIQLSSGIMLIIPGFLTTTDKSIRHNSPSLFLMFGLCAIAISLICGLSEQFLSSLAYDKQIAKTDAYYRKETSDINPPALSMIVRVALALAFLSFLIGVVSISAALVIGPWRNK